MAHYDFFAQDSLFRPLKSLVTDILFCCAALMAISISRLYGLYQWLYRRIRGLWLR